MQRTVKTYRDMHSTRNCDQTDVCEKMFHYCDILMYKSFDKESTVNLTTAFCSPSNGLAFVVTLMCLTQ